MKNVEGCDSTGWKLVQWSEMDRAENWPSNIPKFLFLSKQYS